jgi:uncharacterized protein
VRWHGCARRSPLDDPEPDDPEPDDPEPDDPEPDDAELADEEPMPKVIPPVPDADDQFFWDGVARGTLLLERCAACKTKRHPPSPMCGVCLSIERESFEASGRGTVYSWIASHHPSTPDAEPRIVALIDLEEGLRFVANLQDVALADVHPGLPVEVFFAEVDGTMLPQFRPATGGAR